MNPSIALRYPCLYTQVWKPRLTKRISLADFADVYGSDNNGIEIVTQPQLLFDIGRWIPEQAEHLFIGAEWYYHRNRHVNSSVPQAMMKWVW